MNNKGFTLIELLAVIIILVSISLIAVAGISTSLQRRDASECEEQKKLAVNAAKIYFSLNTNKDQVTIGELKTGDYFSGQSKIDRLNDESYVTFGTGGYYFTGECK